MGNGRIWSGANTVPHDMFGGLTSLTIGEPGVYGQRASSALRGISTNPRSGIRPNQRVDGVAR